MRGTWKTSRKAIRWQHLAPSEARTVLVECYAEEAAAEALLRAFLAERDLRREQARFWVAVYDLIVLVPEAPSRPSR
jgi:hypothetical protein